MSKSYIPYEGKEFQEWLSWQKKASQGDLNPIPSICCWSDICGFGARLDAAKWDLSSPLAQSLLTILSRMHSILAQGWCLPHPDKVLVLNDGVARVFDLIHYSHDFVDVMIFNFRDMILRNNTALQLAIKDDVGLRTVLSGGSRVQYSSSLTTGKSFVFTGENPSPHAKWIMDQHIVYNPAEFQMNTAFARAYTLDALGSSAGLKTNNIYVDIRWVDAVAAYFEGAVYVQDDYIFFDRNETHAMHWKYDKKIELQARTGDTVVFKLNEMMIYKEFEGEDAVFKLGDSQAFS
jgi:hypothetical protein